MTTGRLRIDRRGFGTGREDRLSTESLHLRKLAIPGPSGLCRIASRRLPAGALPLNAFGIVRDSA